MEMKFTAVLGLTLLAACAGRGDQQQAAADSLRRDLELAPADTTAQLNDQPAPQAAPAPAPDPEPAPAPKPVAPKPKPKPKPAAPAPTTFTLGAGTTINGTADDSLHSRHDKAGQTFTATVSEEVRDAKGRVVIPAGASVTFRVAVLEPAKSKSAKDGTIRLEATEVAIGDHSYPITGEATTETVHHTLVGQGVTAGGAARVGGGAAVGAIAGKLIGGKTGAVVGGVAGAAAGTAVAVQTADRDVVVRPGDQVSFTLASDFTMVR